jgi:hypothetical protein
MYETYLLANFATNLKGYWPLGANATDASSGGNNGVTLGSSGGPTFGQTGIPGSSHGSALFAAGKGLRFEANPSSGATSPFASANFTLIAWIKRLGTGTTISSGTGGLTAIEPLICKGMAQAEGGDLDANYVMGLVSSSGMKLGADFEEDDEGSGAYGLNHPITGTATVTDSAWHMLAATYSGTTWNLYLDGANCGTLAVNEPPENESLAAFVVGCGLRTTDADTAPQGGFAGDICHVAMWSVVLTAQNLLDLYNEGMPVTTPVTALDTFANFAKATVSQGYDAAATSIALTTGHGASCPATPFNATWWNATDYPDPTDDPNREIVRVTVRSTDSLTIVRAQEGTSASTKNTSAKTYKLLATLTALTMNAIRLSLPTSGSGSPESVVDGNVGRPYYDTTAKTTYVKETAAGTLTGWIAK